VVRVAYTKSTTANEWNYSIEFPDSDVATPIPPVTGKLTFDSGGHLTAPAAADVMPKIDITGLKTGASNMSLTWNLYNDGAPRFSQYSQPSATSANAQDGAAAAQLLHVGIGNGGLVLAQFSDGKQTVVGQLAMASVRNPESLISVGENAYALSARSALPAIGVPGTGGRGTIIGGAIESSNVDIAREFTNLIVLQRGYQANAKVITTVDDLSQETINLKR
jgi:flagellar hook protein FlgE